MVVISRPLPSGQLDDFSSWGGGLADEIIRMSVTNLTTQPEITAPLAQLAARRGRTGVGWWVRVGLASRRWRLSGTARWWRARQIERDFVAESREPFPLKDLPLNLGVWEGAAAQFDPTIARATGATDFLLRRYVNKATGVAVDAIALYGPATDVVGHIPEKCYPAAGFAPMADPHDQVITAGAVRAPFRSLLYARGEGGQTDYQEVYYSWRFDNRWSPEVGTWKQIERISGMYKLHLARRVTGAPAPRPRQSVRGVVASAAPRAGAPVAHGAAPAS